MKKPFLALIAGFLAWVSCSNPVAEQFSALDRAIDRQEMYDRNEAPQSAPVNMDWNINAEELMTVAHKRLCNQASAETRAVIQEICDQVEKMCPEFEGLLVPMCEYRGGICTEFHPCGRAKVIE